ncbi:MAG: hypothetical protein F4X98_00260 [Gammaproteobacteria bacterium]|nr:hypothetical protein [Gammaproteobacteria bacterium]
MLRTTVRRAMWLIAFLCVAGSVSAQARDLFMPVDRPAVPPSVDDSETDLRTTADVPNWGGETERHRRMRVDFTALDEVREALADGESPTIGVNLFEDVRFEAVDLRTAPTATGYSLAASLRNIPHGTLTLVVNGELVTGTVRTPLATFTIDSSGGPVHIRKVDPSTLRKLAEPLDPARLPKSSRAVGTGDPSASAEDPSVVDLLVLFTPSVTDARGGIVQVHGMVDLWVAETNQAFEDSGADVRVFLTRAVGVDYLEGGASSIDLYRLAIPGDGYLDVAHELREKTGADLVHLIASSNDVCGIAFLMPGISAEFEDRGFGLTSHECGGSTFAHELGHNLSLRHDRYVDPSNSPYAYSHGYVNQRAFEEDASGTQRWRTIMAYPNQCSESGFQCPRLLRYSNPEQSYMGDPLGVAGDSPTLQTDGPADARRSLNNARVVVAAYRGAGPDLAITPVLTDRSWDAGQDVTIVAAVTNQGRIDSGAATATYYRSTDPVIDTDDTALDSFEVDTLSAKETDTHVFATTAPDEHGRFYYGLCIGVVDGETDTTNNCSVGLAVSVGPTVAVSDTRIVEGNKLTFSVEASAAQSTPVEVRWELRQGTAVAGVDYADAAGTITFAANDTFETVSVDTLADELPEGEDTLTLVLVGTSPPGSLVVSPDGGEATGTILDDDDDLRIPDESLRAALNRALGKGSEEDVTADELAELASLVVPSRGIADLTGIQAATALKRLVLNGNSVTDFGPLRHLANLTRLELAENGITDVVGLAELSNLIDLVLSKNDLDDLAPLAGLTALRLLDLESTGVSDLLPLAGLTGMETLHLRDNAVADLSPLQDLSRLSTLDLNYNDVSDLQPLKSLTRLAWLGLWSNGITDVEPLRNLEQLIWLDLDENAVKDIEPLAGLSDLTFLWLLDNEIADLPSLDGLESIEGLDLASNRLVDIGPLASLDTLELLDLGGNAIRSIEALSGLIGLEELFLDSNRIWDISPLAGMTRLVRLDLGDNLVADLQPLAGLTRLRTLDLNDNLIRDVAPLTDLTALRTLRLADNRIRDVEPLVDNAGLRFGDRVYLQGNPLSSASVDDVATLRGRGVTVFDVGLSIAAASALEGDPLEFLARLSSAVDGDVSVNWAAFGVTADEPDDFASGQSGTVRIAEGETEASFNLPTYQDDLVEPHETVLVGSAIAGAPSGVAFSERLALGLIADRDGPRADVPVFAPASDETRQGFVRVSNYRGVRVVHVDAFDDAGNRRSTSLALNGLAAAHFNSDDLEGGNFGKGLSRGVGMGTGDWRLEMRGASVEVLTYMRTRDGFLTSLHDLVPAGPDGYRVPVFNPGSNKNQVSLLRLVNAGTEDATVNISGTDDRGDASPGTVQLVLAAGESRSISAADLESGSGLDGDGLGDGFGKWRLVVASDEPVGVASLLESPTGHLTNLSTTPDNKESVDGETLHRVHLFPSASDPKKRQGFLRVVNRGAAGTVEIQAYDDTGYDPPAVTLNLDENETVHFNSNDLESGEMEKGLAEGVGSGQGDWRLELTSSLDLDVLTYIRRTEDGFLTSMHDTATVTDGVHHVPIFNPGSNRNQVSWLRLMNYGSEPAMVSIRGFDDTGSSYGIVELSVPGESVRMLSAQELEAGASDFMGTLGDGVGKWQLSVRSDSPIHVMSLLESPTGHLTNLSTSTGVLSAE